VPSDGTTELKGTAITAAYSSPQVGAPGIGKRSGPNPATAQITTEGGDVVGASVSAPGSSASFSRGRSRDGIVSFQNASQATRVADPKTNRFEHQTFGAWLTGLDRDRGSISVGSFGTRTPSGSLPSTQQASYNGGSVGVLVDAAGTRLLTTSDVNVGTNFSEVTVQSVNTRTRPLGAGQTDSAASDLNFTAQGPVSGTGFTADLTASGGVAGKVNGRFYGPRAQEVGGTFDTSDGSRTYLGAFGAKR
jgi:hypothetical protein